MPVMAIGYPPLVTSFCLGVSEMGGQTGGSREPRRGAAWRSTPGCSDSGSPDHGSPSQGRDPGSRSHPTGPSLSLSAAWFQCQNKRTSCARRFLHNSRRSSSCSGFARSYLIERSGNTLLLVRQGIHHFHSYIGTEQLVEATVHVLLESYINETAGLYISLK